MGLGGGESIEGGRAAKNRDCDERQKAGKNNTSKSIMKRRTLVKGKKRHVEKKKKKKRKTISSINPWTEKEIE